MTTTNLIQWDKIRTQIEQAKDADELLGLRNKSEALRLWAKQSKQSIQVQNQIAEYRIRSERKLGGILQKTLLNKGGNPNLSSNKTSSEEGLKLKEIGITRDQSSKWQRIADLPEEKFEGYIQAVKKSDDELTTSGVIQKWREHRREEIAEEAGKNTPSMPKGEYDVIYADPPWKYEDFPTKNSRSIENHYPTMELEDIKKMEIPANKNSILLLWATVPKLEGALEVMKAWGFTYRTCAVWDKEVLGMGYWFRVQHEILLVGVKGKFGTPKPENRVASVFREKRTKHSKKPDFFYGLIERMFPKGKYLELFARKKYDKKWAVFGNQI